MNTPLGEIFRYNRWANLELIAACRALSDEQLGAQIVGGSGSVREALLRTRAAVIAISPIVGKAAVSGPTAALMEAQRLPVSLHGVVEVYGEFLDALIADRADIAECRELSARGLRVHTTDIIMRTEKDQQRMGRVAMLMAGQYSLARMALEHDKAKSARIPQPGVEP